MGKAMNMNDLRKHTKAWPLYEDTSLSELLTNINYLAQSILNFIEENYENIQNYKTK